MSRPFRMDMLKALREQNGKYLGNRPMKISKSTWKERDVKEVRCDMICMGNKFSIFGSKRRRKKAWVYIKTGKKVANICMWLPSLGHENVCCIFYLFYFLLISSCHGHFIFIFYSCRSVKIQSSEFAKMVFRVREGEQQNSA